MTEYTKILSSDKSKTLVGVCAYTDHSHQFVFYRDSACTIGPFYYEASNKLTIEVPISLAEYTDILIEILQTAKAAKR